MSLRERFEVLYQAELERQGKTFDPVVFRLEANGDYFIGLVQAAWWGYQQAVPVVDRSAVRDAIAIALSDAYDCTRVWAAWGVGTMSEDDFQLVAEDDERLDEIVDAALVAAGLEVTK